MGSMEARTMVPGLEFLGILKGVDNKLFLLNGIP